MYSAKTRELVGKRSRQTCHAALYTEDGLVNIPWLYPYIHVSVCFFAVHYGSNHKADSSDVLMSKIIM